MLMTSFVTKLNYHRSYGCSASIGNYFVVDGNWGGWSNYDSCSKTCGSGKKAKARRCDNPKPSNGGNFCFGANYKQTTCNTGTCQGWKTIYLIFIF